MYSIFFLLIFLCLNILPFLNLLINVLKHTTKMMIFYTFCYRSSVSSLGNSFCIFISFVSFYFILFYFILLFYFIMNKLFPGEQDSNVWWHSRWQMLQLVRRARNLNPSHMLFLEKEFSVSPELMLRNLLRKLVIVIELSQKQSLKEN